MKTYTLNFLKSILRMAMQCEDSLLENLNLHSMYFVQHVAYFYVDFIHSSILLPLIHCYSAIPRTFGRTSYYQ